jgi:hypothetical protein
VTFARTAAALALATSMSLVAASARAESSEWNLHLDPMLAMPISGLLGPDQNGTSFGGGIWISLDWQPFAPLAFELLLSAAHVDDVNPDPGEGERDAFFGQAALGLRLRWDDHSGYADDPGGSAHGSLWASAHAGIMAWHGPQLAVDVAVGYELSVARPFSIGLFARGVVGLLDPGDDLDIVATAGLTASFEVSVGVIPNGRYGVADVRVEGFTTLDEAAARACIGTRERPQLGFDIGASSSLACGQPPFDAGRWRIDLFSWPWTEWPLFDASVFERDVLRLERWMRARGYYEGRVVSSAVLPGEALAESQGDAAEADDPRCIASPSRGCQAEVVFGVEEGRPVLVERVEVRGEDELDRETRTLLRTALQLRHGDPFDEALYEDTQEEMVRLLANHAYPDATVDGEVKINAERHEAFILYRVDTGRRGVLGRLCVTGYGELPPEPILNATYLSPGQPFSLAELEEAQRAIFQLGTLSSVEIRHRTEEQDEEARREAEADVQEDGRRDRTAVPGIAPVIDPEDPPPPAPTETAEEIESDADADAARDERDGPPPATPPPVGDDDTVDRSEPQSETETPTPSGMDATTEGETPMDPGADAATSDTTGDESTQTEQIATVETPEPGSAADEEAAEIDAERRGGPEMPPYCSEGAPSVPEGSRAVDLEIRVTPGRLERFGIGGGIQVGDTLSFGSQFGSASTTNQQSLQLWDFHLLLLAEWRNLLGDMLRLRIEERPRIIFPAQFPGVVSETGLGPGFGNKILVSIRWPAFIEARTALFAALSHDYGPLPLFGFFRHELDARLGLERTFFDGRLYLSSAVRGNMFIPEGGQSLRVSSQRETTRALILEQIATLDLRDDPRNPTSGAYFGIGLQEAGLGGISSWDYFRVTAEARGYIPLQVLGAVLAMRVGVGAMFVAQSYGLDPNNIYELDALGPPSQQLLGGGSVSNRGVPAGLLGDVVRRAVESRPGPTGEAQLFQPVLVSGGIRRWEASIELRVPITPEIGIVGFTDLGNVSRSEDFHFDVLNLAVGFGLRYRTIIGPLRFDWAFRIPGADYVGAQGADPRPPPCGTERDVECRPVHRIFGTESAIHLTIGESF